MWMKGVKMDFPEDLKYSKEHEWVRIEKNNVVIGISDYAQENLGEIVYVELPDEGSDITVDEAFGVVESTKAVSDLYAPVTGTVVGINDTLLDSPELINEEPYDEGWMIRVKISKPDELNNLLDALKYKSYIEEIQEEA